MEGLLDPEPTSRLPRSKAVTDENSTPNRSSSPHQGKNLLGSKKQKRRSLLPRPPDTFTARESPQSADNQSKIPLPDSLKLRQPKRRTSSISPDRKLTPSSQNPPQNRNGSNLKSSNIPLPDSLRPTSQQTITSTASTQAHSSLSNPSQSNPSAEATKSFIPKPSRMANRRATLSPEKLLNQVSSPVPRPSAFQSALNTPQPTTKAHSRESSPEGSISRVSTIYQEPAEKRLDQYLRWKARRSMDAQVSENEATLLKKFGSSAKKGHRQRYKHDMLDRMAPSEKRLLPIYMEKIEKEEVEELVLSILSDIVGDAWRVADSRRNRILHETAKELSEQYTQELLVSTLEIAVTKEMHRIKQDMLMHNRRVKQERDEAERELVSSQAVDQVGRTVVESLVKTCLDQAAKEQLVKEERRQREEKVRLVEAEKRAKADAAAKASLEVQETAMADAQAKLSLEMEKPAMLEREREKQVTRPVAVKSVTTTTSGLVEEPTSALFKAHDASVEQMTPKKDIKFLAEHGSSSGTPAAHRVSQTIESSPRQVIKQLTSMQGRRTSVGDLIDEEEQCLQYVRDADTQPSSASSSFLPVSTPPPPPPKASGTPLAGGDGPLHSARRKYLSWDETLDLTKEGNPSDDVQAMSSSSAACLDTVKESSKETSDSWFPSLPGKLMAFINVAILACVIWCSTLDEAGEQFDSQQLVQLLFKRALERASFPQDSSSFTPTDQLDISIKPQSWHDNFVSPTDSDSREQQPQPSKEEQKDDDRERDEEGEGRDGRLKDQGAEESEQGMLVAPVRQEEEVDLPASTSLEAVSGVLDSDQPVEVSETREHVSVERDGTNEASTQAVVQREDVSQVNQGDHSDTMEQGEDSTQLNGEAKVEGEDIIEIGQDGGETMEQSEVNDVIESQPDEEAKTEREGQEGGATIEQGEENPQLNGEAKVEGEGMIEIEQEGGETIEQGEEITQLEEGGETMEQSEVDDFIESQPDEEAKAEGEGIAAIGQEGGETMEQGEENTQQEEGGETMEQSEVDDFIESQPDEEAKAEGEGIAAIGQEGGETMEQGEEITQLEEGGETMEQSEVDDVIESQPDEEAKVEREGIAEIGQECSETVEQGEENIIESQPYGAEYEDGQESMEFTRVERDEREIQETELGREGDEVMREGEGKEEATIDAEASDTEKVMRAGEHVEEAKHLDTGEKEEEPVAMPDDIVGEVDANSDLNTTSISEIEQVVTPLVQSLWIGWGLLHKGICTPDKIVFDESWWKSSQQDQSQGLFGWLIGGVLYHSLVTLRVHILFGLGVSVLAVIRGDVLEFAEAVSSIKATLSDAYEASFVELINDDESYVHSDIDDEDDTFFDQHVDDAEVSDDEREFNQVQSRSNTPARERLGSDVSDDGSGGLYRAVEFVPVRGTPFVKMRHVRRSRRNAARQSLPSTPMQFPAQNLQRSSSFRSEDDETL